ncbi:MULTISPECIES: AraC family transcriptional regulator [unclassified Burkholderia]|uniref:AraC family transcriptional regulator n=1 Tax=unclassified Burkholderia TaxID=2613784 RepID=UPI00214FF98B|nr:MULTISPECIES: AraC family transcriptional regulator [unclassified Burkholderia]MCR4471571.1 AraC family transcriptional regulator [Burkholderia sp. SCN-KJ]
MNPAIAATPIAFAQSIIRAYERYGIDPRNALRAAQIQPSSLPRTDVCMTADQLEVLTDIAMRELDDEALGWFSRRLPWGTNGMLCRAALPSANLRVALSRWCRHYAMLIDDIRLELRVEGGVAHLNVYERANLGPQREFCLVSTLRNIHGFACWLIDSRIPLTSATFPYPEPAYFKSYDLMFRGRVSFLEPHAGFSFDAEYLKLPIRRDDHDLRQMLLRPLPLIVLQYRRDRLLSQRLRDLLRTRSLELSNADVLAFELNLSTRSLYRHLAEEGTSLQHIKDEVRRDVAKQLLTRSHKSLKQVAAAAGFRNEASFNRAFRRWTGQSPGEYRQSMKGA